MPDSSEFALVFWGVQVRRLVVAASIFALSTSTFAYAGAGSGSKLSVERELLGLHALQLMSKVSQEPALVASTPRLLRQLSDNLDRQKTKPAVLNELGSYPFADRMAVAWGLTHAVSNAKPTVTLMNVSESPRSIGQDPPPDPKDVSPPASPQNPTAVTPSVEVVPTDIALQLDYRVSWYPDGNGVVHMVYDHRLSATLQNSPPYHVFYSGGFGADVVSCGYWFYTCTIASTILGEAPFPHGASGEDISIHSTVEAIANLGFTIAGQTFGLPERAFSHVDIGTSNCVSGSAHGGIDDGASGVFINGG